MSVGVRAYYTWSPMATRSYISRQTSAPSLTGLPLRQVSPLPPTTYTLPSPSSYLVQRRQGKEVQETRVSMGVMFSGLICMHGYSLEAVRVGGGEA